MRGEHEYLGDSDGEVTGSSPHARGAHQLRVGEAEAEGIIPACAGSTVSMQATARGGRDHPRMRGEHLLDDTFYATLEGSSPHARGAQ